MALPTRSATKLKGKPVPSPLIGSFLLESITTGMYGERRNAIREYVQNSFDGVQAAISGGILKEGAGKVTVTVEADDKNLVIYDNGIGLPQRIAVNTLTAVGASRKERGRQAGFRGIGRLAGIAFSTVLRFRTKSVGDSVETVVEFNCDELRTGMLSSGRTPAAELITACTTWDQRPVSDAKSHYFEVSLLGLKNAPVEASDPLQLRTFLSQVAPVDFHSDFGAFWKKIREEADALTPPTLKHEEQNPANWLFLDDDEASMLARIPVSCISLVIRSGKSANEEPVHKPYRRKMGVDDSDSVPLSTVTVHYGEKSGAWWGWVGHKAKPGEYQDSAVAGIRFRLKNIQIDGNELILQVPTTNEQRSTFGRWSEWFVGEIHVDPRAVVPNARRDNFEEDEHWLVIREEITEICTALTTEARKVSKEHQTSLEVLEKKVTALRDSYLKISRSKTFDLTKVRKILADSDKIQKDIEKASGGASASVQLGLKSMAQELTKIRVSLLEKPKTPEFEQFRQVLRRELLDKVLSILNEHLDIDVYEEVKIALEKGLK